MCLGGMTQKTHHNHPCNQSWQAKNSFAANLITMWLCITQLTHSYTNQHTLGHMHIHTLTYTRTHVCSLHSHTSIHLTHPYLSILPTKLWTPSLTFAEVVWLARHSLMPLTLAYEELACSKSKSNVVTYYPIHLVNHKHTRTHMYTHSLTRTHTLPPTHIYTYLHTYTHSHTHD